MIPEENPLEKYLQCCYTQWWVTSGGVILDKITPSGTPPPIATFVK